MLTLKNLTKTFTDEPVLKNISLSFEDGKTTAILGPSGSGKSTLLRLINLLEQPDQGEIQLEDKIIAFPQKLPFKELRQHRANFSMVFQAFNLFPHLTVVENVMEGPTQVKKVPAAVAKQQARQLLQLVGLSEKSDSYPKSLSGGQQQRVAIARALAMEPKFILYDEPTSALDPELAQEVLNVIQNLADQGNSQIIVTHHVDFARKIADRILFIENGTVFYDGDTEHFFISDIPRIQQFIQRVSQ
ncbi:amino acid ABC transporter ATP-binding protein [Enterococcus sp. 669A]|uniref:Amino acid ABC transporter ATP-binding protein n=1 Tax=Candidatus Enterococcus moelleringii TaxID=2815325 RepID=A0ABS3LGX6_9ENTE|nr:amino acid ABC transporter ATP-binding protein [Enterococcus sp. 669A]MBO1307966.1 amino acid ABC transporter ATP-binding protein [Enterococcus sp. 669A]